MCRIFISIIFTSFSSIFTILFLRKSFWTPTINTFFILSAPFSRYPSFTFCHSIVMRENNFAKGYKAETAFVS